MSSKLRTNNEQIAGGFVAFTGVRSQRSYNSVEATPIARYFE